MSQVQNHYQTIKMMTVGTFQMCPICYYHEIAGLIQPKLSMFSTCNHWFQAPLPPVLVVMIIWLTIYRNTKKGNFDGLCKWPQEMVWDGISKKGNFDGLYKWVMWPTKNENCRGIGGYVSRSCDLSKISFLMAYISILGEYSLKNYQKRKFNRLHKQIMWSTKKWKMGVAYTSGLCDLLKVKMGAACLGKQVMWPAQGKKSYTAWFVVFICLTCNHHRFCFYWPYILICSYHTFHL